jgi:hypothetical protein
MTIALAADRELKATDRCDRCSAAAQVVVKLLNGELYFCGHHANDMAPALKAKGFDIWDPFNSIR